MLKLVLWSILAIWVGIAVVMFGGLILTVLASTARMVRDRFGKKSSVYCPVHERTMAVVGIPTSFGTAPFDDLRRCEAFEQGEIRCKKTCLKWEQRGSASS
ncbi:MAG: hypothetical protein AAB409_01975 [Gemmatimonadota bacterium]